ncbi:hypothetical protein [Streptomyces sp. PA5.6]|uniref:hypothetical protein n=1 Tax=Streptomyces sp. PA5.6 TaxID=3035651 RepID=UPI003904A165
MKHEDLVQSSRHLMHEALGGLTVEPITHNLTILKAGVATEHLLKAYLCTIHPSLITDAKDLPTLLHAAGRPDLASKPLTMVKTIGIVEAYKRAHAILGKGRLTLDPQKFQEIADARNGVAHLAMSSAEGVERLLSLVIKVADALLTAMQEDAKRFWGLYAPVREKILEEGRKADLIIIAALKTKAGKTLVDRFGDRDNERRQEAIETASQYCGVRGTGAEKRTCPACSNQGWLGGDLTTAFDDEDQPKVILVTKAFKCSVCGFAVHGPMLQYFDNWIENLDYGPAATFEYGDGTTHLELYESLLAEEYAADWNEETRRRREEDRLLRVQLGVEDA